MEKTETQQSPISEINNNTPIVNQHNLTKKKLFLVLTSVFVLATVLVVFMGVGGGKTTKVVNAPAKIVEDDMEGWKTYRNENLGVSFEYPPEYSVLKETNSEVELGVELPQNTTSYTYLTIHTANISDLQSIPVCNDTNNFPCISKDGWNQQQPITDISISGTDVYSAYVYYGLDSVARIIQTKDIPKVELSMDVAGGGLDRDFMQILSTLEFTN